MRELIIGKTDYKAEVEKIRTYFKDYVTNANLKSVVLGVSGGIDSAIIAALVAPVCKETGVKLIGISLPANSNQSDEKTRAIEIGESFCDVFSEKSIEKLYENMWLEACPCEVFPSFADKIRLGNIKARIRMILLYDMSQRFNGLVMSTDNLTEYLLGFWTLHGDVGDLGLIQKLWKTDIYQMSSYLINSEIKDERAKKSLQSCIDAVPTDGLGITRSDLEQIGGESYMEVDKVLYRYLTNNGGDKSNPIIQRYERTHFKRTNPSNLEF